MEIKLKIEKQENRFHIYINDIHIDYFKEHAEYIENSTLAWLNSILDANMKIKEMQKHLIENYLEEKIDKNVEEMTYQEFAEYLVENIDGLYFATPPSTVNYKRKVVYRIYNDNINYMHWNNAMLLNKLPFCKFDGHRLNTTASKGNRKQFVHIVKQVIEHCESFKIVDFED